MADAETPAATVRIAPRCAAGEQIFVSSEGWLLPCCYAHILLRRTLAAPERCSPADRFFHDHRERFDLNRRTAEEVLADPCWEDLRQSWTTDQAPSICYRYCGVLADGDYATPNDLKRRDRQQFDLTGDGSEAK